MIHVYLLEIGGNSKEIVDLIKLKAKERFGNITDMGQLTSYLGLEIVDVVDYVTISRRQVIDDLEQGLAGTVPQGTRKGQVVPTPLAPSFSPVKELPNVGTANILESLGKLNYEANRGRHDIKFSCSYLGSKATCAPDSFVQMITHLQQYLVKTRDLTVRLGGDDKKVVLFGYADASFSKAAEGSLGYMGYCFFLGRDAGTVSSASSKIKTACTSSTEAEIKALREALKEVVWMRGLLAEIGLHQEHPTIIFQDNVSTIALCGDERSVHLPKHVMPLLAVIREAINEGIIKLVYCPTRWMVADILTSNASRGDEYKVLRTILMSGHQSAHQMMVKEGKNYNDSPLKMLFG
jgi:hypothetical protein